MGDFNGKFIFIRLFSIFLIERVQFTTIPGIGWIGGFAPISGVILCVILAIIAIFSMNCIRYKGHSRVNRN